MILTSKATILEGHHGPIRVRRTAEGVVRVKADTDEDLALGLGFAHAHDRLVQMETVRLAGQGRLSECLSPTEESLQMDLQLRGMGIARDAEADVSNVGPGAISRAQAYCDGVNMALAQIANPLAFTLLHHRPAPWRIADSLAAIKILTYVGLAQSQQEMEKLIIESVVNGVDLDRLKKLFEPHLDGFDPSVLDGLVHLERLVPRAIKWDPALPVFVASNNWVLDGTLTASGRPMLCNDPHLDINRLPSVWYEAVLEGAGGRYAMGATMPGVDGVIIGRTRDVAMGLTYGFADQIDYFVEEVRDGQYKRGDAYFEFERRDELIKRKGTRSVKLTVLENHHGVLEGDATEDGRYLCKAWALHKKGASCWLNALPEISDAETAQQLMAALGKLTLSANWVIADVHGNIAYQQSGRVPMRAPEHSGLFPVPGWDRHYDWKGFVFPDSMSRRFNPDCGYLATANENYDQEGQAKAVNLSMSSYRGDRIREILDDLRGATVGDMKRMQGDLESHQVRKFMDLLKPVLPDTVNGRRLAEWKGTYGVNSVEAAWFEEIYRRLRREVFGEALFGRDVWDFIDGETGLTSTYHGLFDRALLSGSVRWFPEEDRAQILARIAAAVLAERPARWGDRSRVVMKNLLWADRMPSWAGFDVGPIELPGCRATLVQAGVFRSGGHETGFTASYRLITDLGTDSILTNLAGGPSGSRWSPWYVSDLERWQRVEYKRLDAVSKPDGVSSPLRTASEMVAAAIGVLSKPGPS